MSKQTLLEQKLEQTFKDLLDAKEITVVKGNPRGLKGFPDRQVFGDKIYYVELKVGKEYGSYYKQTKMQKWWQRKIEASSGTYVLLTGEKEVRDFVDKLPSQKKGT